MSKNRRPISGRFKFRAMISVVAVFILSVIVITFIGYGAIDSVVASKTDTTLDIFTSRLMAEIKHLDIILDSTKQTLDEKHVSIANAIEYMLDSVPEENMTPGYLQHLAEPLDIIELNVADANGILAYSNIPEIIGFDYKSFEPTKVYMALVSGELTEISEEPRRSVFDDDEYGDINHYTGVARRAGGFVQLGFNADVIARLRSDISIAGTIRDTQLGENGYGMVILYGIIAAHPSDAMTGKDVTGEGWYDAISDGDGFAWVDIGGARYYAGYKNAGGYTAVGLIPQDDFFREIRTLLVSSALMLLLTVAVMITLLYATLSGLLRPVKHLVGGLEKIAEGDLSTRLEGEFSDEFGEIKDAVNAMADGIETLFNEQKAKQEKILKLEREMTQKQIQVMLSQIQPHFIYNSLVVIRHLCRIDPKMAEETVVEFSEYLRGNLDSLSMSELIPFERELRHVDVYLRLEKKRFGEKLNVVYGIGADDFLLPMLTLQPIVENAVRHGVTKKDGGGTIEVKTEKTGGDIVITVTDDGPGFGIQRAEDERRSHVGVENVRSRLAAMCGGTLEITSAPESGTTVTITIPGGDDGA